MPARRHSQSRRPIMESTPCAPGMSFHCEVVRGRSYGAKWHFHAEHQITLVLKSSGHRIVGDHLAPLTVGDLVLVGGGLPHVWHQDPSLDSSRAAVHAIILRFRHDVFGSSFWDLPEMEPVRHLLVRATRGLAVVGAARDKAQAQMEALSEAGPMERVILLLQLLQTLADSTELSPLASLQYAPELRTEDQARMQRVLRFIHEHIAEGASREAAAACCGLSEGAFSRFFKSHTGRTLPQYVNELRLGRACTRLMETNDKILDIAMDSGFENLANFNRQFLRLFSKSPTAYRRSFIQHSMG